MLCKNHFGYVILVVYGRKMQANDLCSMLDPALWLRHRIFFSCEIKFYRIEYEYSRNEKSEANV